MSPVDIDIILITWGRSSVRLLDNTTPGKYQVDHLGADAGPALLAADGVVVVVAGVAATAGAALGDQRQDGLGHGGDQARVLVLQHRVIVKSSRTFSSSSKCPY